MRFSSSFRLAICTLVILSFFLVVKPAQKVDRARLDSAASRATKATKALTDALALPRNEAIPKELIKRAKAIAVFPDTSKANLLFMKVMKGNGLVVRRVEDGWSMPGFYAFAVMDGGWSKTKSGSPDIIMLFMGESARAFADDHVPLFSMAGPVGELAPEQAEKLENAGIIVYAFADGKVWGIEVKDDSSVQSGINSDNNFNKAVYGLKARDVLKGTPPVQTEIPSAITEFQKVLTSMTKQ